MSNRTWDIHAFAFHTHMGLRSMKKVIKSFWVTAGESSNGFSTKDGDKIFLYKKTHPVWDLCQQ